MLAVVVWFCLALNKTTLQLFLFLDLSLGQSMGKRRSAFAGLSRFAFEAFGNPDAQPSKPEIVPDEQAHGASNASNKHTRPISQLEHEPLAPGEPSRKKHKTGLLGPGYERYDATGLTPYYTDPSEVPEHLRKCTLTQLYLHGDT